MTDAELRALVRRAVARHLGSSAAVQPPSARALSAAHQVSTIPHPSHYLYLTVVNTTDSCVIEPSVTCSHCGYCKSHGH